MCPVATLCCGLLAVSLQPKHQGMLCLCGAGYAHTPDHLRPPRGRPSAAPAASPAGPIGHGRLLLHGALSGQHPAPGPLRCGEGMLLPAAPVSQQLPHAHPRFCCRGTPGPTQVAMLNNDAPRVWVGAVGGWQGAGQQQHHLADDEDQLLLMSLGDLAYLPPSCFAVAAVVACMRQWCMTWLSRQGSRRGATGLLSNRRSSFCSRVSDMDTVKQQTCRQQTRIFACRSSCHNTVEHGCAHAWDYPIEDAQHRMRHWSQFNIPGVDSRKGAMTASARNPRQARVCAYVHDVTYCIRLYLALPPATHKDSQSGRTAFVSVDQRAERGITVGRGVSE
jgi:hypothetical protein